MNLRELINKIDRITEGTTIATQNDADGGPDYFKIYNGNTPDDNEFETFDAAQRHAKETMGVNIQAPSAVPAAANTQALADQAENVAYQTPATTTGADFDGRKPVTPDRAAALQAKTQNMLGSGNFDPTDPVFKNTQNPSVPGVPDPHAAMSSMTNQVGNMVGNTANMRGVMDKMKNIQGMPKNSNFSSTTTSQKPTMGGIPSNGGPTTVNYHTSTTDPAEVMKNFPANMQAMLQQPQGSTTTNQPSPENASAVTQAVTTPPQAAQPSYDTMPFGQAFASARKAGLQQFNWKGKPYTTKQK